jgi:hypothetical protein
MLNRKSVFIKLNDEVDCWLQQKFQLISRLCVCKSDLYKDLSEIEVVLTKISQHIAEINHFTETKIKHLSQLAIEINGTKRKKTHVRMVDF